MSNFWRYKEITKGCDNMDWDEFFIELCKTVSKKSKDKSTKIGCVIVGPDNEVRSIGYNGFPRGVIDKTSEDKIQIDDLIIPQQTISENNKKILSRFERPLKYKWTEHAERNAIYNAARAGIKLKNCTIYIYGLPPCTDCSRAIIQSGIKTIIYQCSNKEIPERWSEDISISKEMLNEACITIKEINNEERTL